MTTRLRPDVVLQGLGRRHVRKRVAAFLLGQRRPSRRRREGQLPERGRSRSDRLRARLRRGLRSRTLAGQGTGLMYGWVEPGTSTPRDLSIGGSTPGNGRDRGFSDSQSLAQRLDTFMHMQANNISGTFNGTPLPGSWEIDLPNGTYTVTVSAGDANVSTTDPESHTINIEGVNAISAFVPSGAAAL